MKNKLYKKVKDLTATEIMALFYNGEISSAEMFSAIERLFYKEIERYCFYDSKEATYLSDITIGEPVTPNLLIDALANNYIENLSYSMLESICNTNIDMQKYLAK